MIAFFDMPEGQVYLFDRKTGRLVDKVPFGTGDGFEFRVERGLPEGIEESCVSLPLRLLNFRVLELELADIEKIREVLPFELEGLILDEPESVVIDARIIEDLNGRRKVLAVYLQKSVLKELLDALGALGMDPRVVTSLDLGLALDTYTSVEEMSRRLLLDRLIEGDERVQRALREIENPVVNLRRGELSYTRDAERTKRTLKFTAAAALLLMLFFSADMALRTAGTKKQAAGIERGILNAYSDIFPGEKPQGARGLTYRMKAHLKDMKDRAAFSSGLSPLELLLGLQGLGLPGLTDITMDKDFIVLKGEASSLSEVQGAKGRLEGFLLDVNISETGQSVRDKIAFTITARGSQTPLNSKSKPLTSPEQKD